MASFVTRLLTFITFVLLPVTLTALPTNTDNAALVERQKGCGPNLPCGELVGDGDPHQVIWQKQISTTFNCGGPTCVVSDFQQHSFGIRAQLPEDTTWITGGLQVTDYVNTGIYDGECKADPGHRVCIYADIYFTDYSVRSGDRSDCFSTKCNFRDGYQIIRAPNMIDQGVSYRCAYDNDCAEQGHENWVQGPAGAPRMLSVAADSISTDSDTTALVERQHGCTTISCSGLVGNGDPHQWLLHKQVSSWIDCGEAACAIGETQLGEEFTLKADSGGADFTFGGFNVLDQLTIPVFGGECKADAGHRVCVKSVIWWTHYTVGRGTKNTCFDSGCDIKDDTTIIKAPNAIDNGIEYYCAFDDACSEKGHEDWLTGPAGGPPNALTSAEALDKRQACMPGASCTKLEGNGDPHQWIMHKQLSEKLDCGDSYCLVANVHEIDYPIKANTHGSDWISGDFAVEEEVHTGRSNLACTGGGDQPGQYVCSYAAIWHTDYTVRPGTANSCAFDGCQEFDETNIIRSPNTIHDGKIEYYCAWDDACGEQGQENWIAGPAMGPPEPALEQALPSADLAERQNHCMPAGGCAALEGDGDPHQWIKRIQISPFFYCERVHGTLDMCDMFEGRGQISYSLKADIGDAGEWIDGGFDVVESLDTEIFKGNCPGESIDTVCVFANIYHTDYTVRGGLANECDKDGCIQNEETSIIRSPNAIKEGGTTFECARNGFCQGQGDFDWIPGPASGTPAPSAEKSPASASLIERQSCNEWNCATLEGDGDPHQWILRKQLSDTLVCEAASEGGDCGMVTETDQLAYELFADTHDTGAWTDGGFKVEQSLWTGKYWGDCKGNPGDQVCLWVEIWHTEYTVRGGLASSCDGSQCKTRDYTSTIIAPNTIPNPEEDTTFVCALNEKCKARGSEEWVAGPAMGPPTPVHTSA